MNVQELALVKKVVDEDLPALINAEILRLPVQYQPLGVVLSAALIPLLVKAIDEKLAAVVPA